MVIVTSQPAFQTVNGYILLSRIKFVQLQNCCCQVSRSTRGKCSIFSAPCSKFAHCGCFRVSDLSRAAGEGAERLKSVLLTYPKARPALVQAPGSSRKKLTKRSRTVISIIYLKKKNPNAHVGNQRVFLSLELVLL